MQLAPLESEEKIGGAENCLGYHMGSRLTFVHFRLKMYECQT